ncbi:hypothetical protein HYFRA_00005524 [Hymenoscyphus fraxineus]|uniref:SnoaL-like domain-containing protein n=1 Tax=Hymenoscyphus fraxineus TaxID=746836 RepID=A0A9N9PGH6_9HELO|nr:hypothetical protein HYFRA_00005524 [Hymenoscyphus fraxineus]
MSQNTTHTKRVYPLVCHASSLINPEIRSFFAEFYRISDTPSAHVLYADQFTQDAILIMGSKKSVGRSEILAFRKSMWEKVHSRSHTPEKIFPFGNQEIDEVMIYGVVKYELKDGGLAEVDWAARANLVKEDETWRMGFYQVYLDTAAMQNPKGK